LAPVAVLLSLALLICNLEFVISIRRAAAI